MDRKVLPKTSNVKRIYEEGVKWDCVDANVEHAHRKKDAIGMQETTCEEDDKYSHLRVNMFV